MQMDCAGMLLTGSVGLTERQLAFIVTRGGMRDEEEEASSWP
jgi:hypothetical protein